MLSRRPAPAARGSHLLREFRELVAVRVSWPTLIIAAIVATGLAAGVRVAVQARRPTNALVELVASMPAPAGRLAVPVSPSRERQAPTFDARRLETWPPRALDAVQTALRYEASKGKAAVRLWAAIDLYQSECPAAVARLEEGLRISQGDPDLLNDASVAYLCVASQAPELAGPSLVRALERALSASEIRPDWPQPQFNLSEASHRFGLNATEEDALRHEIPLERDLVSRQQAKARLSRLKTSDASTVPFTVQEFQETNESERLLKKAQQQPQAVREFIELPLFSAWADAASATSRRAIEANLALIGARRSARFGDAFIVDLAAAAQRATSARRYALVQGHLAYARGRALYDSGDREGAGLQFAAARADLSRGESPFALEAHLQEAIVLYQVRQLEQAKRELSDVRFEALARRYLAIEARANWILGLIGMQEGHVEDAVGEYEKALAVYQSLGELENATSVANSAADTLRIAGDRQRGWRLLLQAAQGLTSIESLQRQYLILFNLSLYAQDEGLLRAAEVFQTLAVSAAERRGAMLTVIESHLRRAQLALKLGKTDLAKSDIATAASNLEGVRSPSSGAYLAAWKERMEAVLLRPRDPASAAARLEQLAARFDQIEPAELPSLYLEASRSSTLARDNQNAVRLLRTALGFVAKRQTLLKAPEYRITSLSATSELFHDLIGIEFAEDPKAALGTAEVARQTLLGQTAHEPPTDLRIPSLPRDAAILYYTHLNDRLLLWVVTSAGTMSRSLPYSFDELAADIDAYRGVIQTNKHDALQSPLARRISDRLLAPAMQLVPGHIKRLLVAADGAIGDLPMATLPDPGRKGLLVERYEVVFIPSLATLRITDGRQMLRSVLAVGYNGKRESGTVPLEAAEHEAQAVGTIYAERKLLTGPLATPASVKAAASDVDVVHIAAHARANRLLPWRSQLTLASDDDRSVALLEFEEIANWNLRRAHLVVLSACETATGARLQGQGVISLTMPFLSAGAKAVVGTLWNVDDRASDSFMQIFHHLIAAGHPPGAALRLAQLEAVVSADRALRLPSLWGAYVIHTREVDEASAP
jgi:CHAT domain-containing protein